MSFNRDYEKNKVKDLNTRSRRVNLTIKVVSKNPVREVLSRRDGSTHRVTEALVGDETGTILLTLWNQDIDRVNEGDVFDINNGYITLFRGSMRLNVGRYGKLESSDAAVEEVNTENNVSDKFFEEERRYNSGFRRSSTGRGWR